MRAPRRARPLVQAVGQARALWRGDEPEAAAPTWWLRQLWWQVAAAIAVVAYTISLLTVHRPADGYNSLWDGWVCTLGGFIPIVPCLLRSATSPRLRSAWFAIGAGILFYDLGNVVYLFHDQNLHPIPFPAPSDAFYIAEYPLFALGIVLLTQRNFGAVRVSARLDGAVTGLSVGALAGFLWFDPILKVSGRPLQALVGLSYPLMDLVLIVLIVSSFAPRRYRPSLPMGILLAGFVAFVCGDIVYLNQVNAGTYVQGTILDCTWPIGLWLMGLAAWPNERRRAREDDEISSVPQGITIVPIVFGGVSILVLVLSLLHHTSPVISSLALASLVLVLVRMAMTLHEVLEVERRNFEAARIDELTGLPNRRAFFEQGEALLEEADDGAHVGIVIIDLDGFKEINDSLGHASGDELLRVVASRLHEAFRHRGTTSRIGGDEFACTLEIANADDLDALGEAMSSILTAPVSVDGMSVRVGASIGMAVHPDHGATLTEVLRCADVAMYKAKMSHTVVRRYRPEDDVHTRDQLRIIDDLRTTDWERDLVLHFQPTLDLRTGRIAGVEALVRWRHERFGLLYPDDFIPLAERTGLIHALTSSVLDRALRTLAALRSEGHDLTMSVNVSRFDLLDDLLPAHVADLLGQAAVPARCLTLEITETAVGEDPEHAAKCIRELRALGALVSMDDFGVGYSSMSRLLALDLDELKIDKSFVLALRSDERARAMIAATVEFARALHMSVVAEGIETPDTLAAVQRLGVDVGQGYLISVPLTEAQLRAFLAARPAMPCLATAQTDGRPKITAS